MYYYFFNHRLLKVITVQKATKIVLNVSLMESVGHESSPELPKNKVGGLQSSNNGIILISHKTNAGFENDSLSQINPVIVQQPEIQKQKSGVLFTQPSNAGTAVDVTTRGKKWYATSQKVGDAEAGLCMYFLCFHGKSGWQCCHICGCFNKCCGGDGCCNCGDCCENYKQCCCCCLCFPEEQGFS